MKELRESNAWQYRLLRTVIEAAVSFLAVNTEMIVAEWGFIPEQYKPMMVGVFMAILTPLLAKPTEK